MSHKTIGGKIRFFRKRAGLSQIELESEINGAAGFISRIESGTINPSKETLLKIIEALDLSAKESAGLFSLDINNDLVRVLNVSKKISSSQNLDDVLQNAVNEIAYELKLLGAAIYILKEDRLYSRTFTNTWYSELALKIINKPLGSQSMGMKDNPDNLLVKCINEKKPQYSLFARDFASPMVHRKIIDILQRLAKHKCGISFPIYSGEKPLGAILFSKNYVDDFKEEMDVLNAFVGYIGDVIVNAQRYEELKESYESLKRSKQ